ncbi:hypothetical protein SISSUDRAFT_1049257 [Sistotremastrum suecicum HHB10207 ss-3]|uniref:MYND-type domain-containing protein n=1 Tax=Sistotremastrum suecicum HHB10207 ss-3 TaxID=1314776 RepID=A0A166BXL0_9AGAM|nr:hypothetical protein SISSUDRAFT_1049257 [Sistotremastrum suecicum HHB10207 ss-3]
MTRTCTVCGIRTHKTCTGCRFTAYCSTRCQKEHWILHVVECDNPGREITTADRLAAGVLSPGLLNHKQTLLDYCLLQACVTDDQERLIAMYTELFQDLGIKPAVVHKWRIERRLHEGLVQAFKAAGERASPATLEWLSCHAAVFDSEYNMEDARTIAHSFAQSRELVAWVYIGMPQTDTVEDMVRTRSTWTHSQIICFMLYVALLTANPVLTMGDPWVVFGYCVFLDDDPIVEQLDSLYCGLISRCTFEEFHNAFITCTLLDLMDRKGLQGARNQMPPEFTSLMCRSTRHLPPIWRFKAYIVSQRIETDHHILISYGFANCSNDAEHNRLRLLYAKAFREWKISALPLQVAMQNNRIYEYIASCPYFKGNKAERQFLRRILCRRSELSDEDIHALIVRTRAGFVS